eukprot:TRINITY_DN33680_c0_g1_i1.p1 TRINITY_DN33680_c0_g1~~TRINITY_DN33680_c0_g1_i1.p1  ORF type:complete len:550 (+),score=109.44 TRINITY_DN33680_c0_g1_i1:80-1729(+)
MGQQACFGFLLPKESAPAKVANAPAVQQIAQPTSEEKTPTTRSRDGGSGLKSGFLLSAQDRKKQAKQSLDQASGSPAKFAPALPESIEVTKVDVSAPPSVPPASARLEAPAMSANPQAASKVFTVTPTLKVEASPEAFVAPAEKPAQVAADEVKPLRNVTNEKQSFDESLSASEKITDAKKEKPVVAVAENAPVVEKEQAQPTSEPAREEVPAAQPVAAATSTVSWVDVSPMQDTRYCKFVVVESTAKPAIEEGVTPTDGARIEFEFAWRRLAMDNLPDPSQPWSFGDGEPRLVTLGLGDCECCDAVESGLASMKRGETCVVRCGASGRGQVQDWTDDALGIRPTDSQAPVDVSNAAVDIYLKLVSCEKEKDVMEMEPIDRAAYASDRKDAAAKYFKAGRYIAALNKYKLVSDTLDYVDDIKDPDANALAKANRIAAKLNEAACCLKLDDNAGAIRVCTEVLKDKPDNEKAYYRRATAYLKQSMYTLSEVDLKRCLEISPANQEARRLLAQCKAEAKESGAGQKDVYAKMLKGAGTGRAGTERRPQRKR